MTALSGPELIEVGKDAVDWALHLSRVGIWTLASIWCVLTALRLA